MDLKWSSTFWECWSSNTQASGRILKWLYQLRALVPRIIDARIDGMVNKFSRSKLSRELDRGSSISHSRIQPSGLRVFRQCDGHSLR
jgi:hypothetical protein